MADYWKSQDKKFCDFCKCWIQDNKPSIQFHESGRRHKNNVEKRLDHIKRTANKQQKETSRLENEMKKIENAALLSYSRDISVNPDYSSAQIISRLQSSGQNLSDILPLTRASQDPMLPYKPQQQHPDKKKKDKKKKEKKKKPVWYEAISPEGYTYYWHSETQQSVWEPPKQFISIKMQEMFKQQEAERKKEEEEREKAFLQAQREIEEAKLRQEAARNGVDFDMERRAWLKREEMKKLRRPEIKKTQEASIPGAIIEPSRTDPYGNWTTVKHVEPKPVNLQLPKINTEVIEVTLPPEQTEMHIEEKTVESLPDDGDTSVKFEFKKRKTNRGNMRQRNADGD